MTIIKRKELGRPLTWDELDSNFQQVDNLVLESNAAVQSATTQANLALGYANQSSASATSAAASAASAGSAVDAAIANVYSTLGTTGTGKGTRLLATKSPLAGAVERWQHDKNTDAVSVLDFGATLDGTLRPLSQRFSTLSAAQMVYPFVTSLTQSTDYAGIQAAAKTGKVVLIPRGFAFVNAAILLDTSVKIFGESTGQINRAQTFISVDGDIPLFTNVQGTSTVTRTIQIHIEGLYIFYNPGTTPVASTGNSNKIAFRFVSDVPGSSGLEMSTITNCTIHGAWTAYYDMTGTYLTKLSNVWARNCHFGFLKGTGTTILMESCYTMGCISPYEFGAVMSLTMINCAMDQSAISDTGGSLGFSGIHLTGVHSYNILGFDAESNDIYTAGGGTSSLIHAENSNGVISGFTAWKNSMRTSGGGTVAFIRTSGTSRLKIIESEDALDDVNAIPYMGSGYPVTLLAQDTSRIRVEGGRWRNPAGGTPVISVLAQGNVAFRDSTISGQVIGGYVESISSAGLKTPGVYTDKGSVSVPVTTATALFTIPDVAGSYIATVWAAGSGTGYCATLSVVYDGSTVFVQAIKSASFLTFTASGRVINVSSSGATTLNWSYLKIS